jgi:hypothetical protein
LWIFICRGPEWKITGAGYTIAGADSITTGGTRTKGTGATNTGAGTPILKLKKVFGLISDIRDADANVGAEYITGGGATKTGAGRPTPIPRLRNTSESAFDLVESKIAPNNNETMMIIFFIHFSPRLFNRRALELMNIKIHL